MHLQLKCNTTVPTDYIIRNYWKIGVTRWLLWPNDSNPFGIFDIMPIELLQLSVVVRKNVLIVCTVILRNDDLTILMIILLKRSLLGCVRKFKEMFLSFVYIFLCARKFALYAFGYEIASCLIERTHARLYTSAS